MTNTLFMTILSLIVILQALSFFALKMLIQNAIQFEFRKKEQAVMVASLFAEWIDCPKERKELNRLTWEAILWLPDDLAREVNKRLNNAPDAKNIKEILVDIKSLIHGKKSNLNPMDIVHFAKEKEQPSQVTKL